MGNFYDEVYYKERDLPPKLLAKYKEDKRREIAFLKSVVSPNPSERLLDLGCGVGDYLGSLNNSGADLWGIDISAKAIELARTKVKNPSQIICSDASLSSQFKEDFFDYVTSWGVIEHFPSTEEILKEIVRITKPGGKVVCMVPNLFYYKFLWDNLRKGRAPVRHQAIENLYAFGDWKKYIENSGLTIDRVERHNKFNRGFFWPVFRNLIPFYLSNHYIFICTKRIS